MGVPLIDLLFALYQRDKTGIKSQCCEEFFLWAIRWDSRGAEPGVSFLIIGIGITVKL